MDSIQTRLQDTSGTCLEAYAAWEKNKTDSKAQEDLQAAIHELRKVSSRLEIELAISERDQMTSKPLPIPSHRSNSKGNKSNHPDDLDDAGQGPNIVQKSNPKRRKPPQRKQASGE